MTDDFEIDTAALRKLGEHTMTAATAKLVADMVDGLRADCAELEAKLHATKNRARHNARQRDKFKERLNDPTSKVGRLASQARSSGQALEKCRVELDETYQSVIALEQRCIELERDRDRYFKMKSNNAEAYKVARDRKQELEHAAKQFVNGGLTAEILHDAASAATTGSIFFSVAQKLRQQCATAFGITLEKLPPAAEKIE